LEIADRLAGLITDSRIHVYDTATSRPVAIVLRPGKTPSITVVPR